MNHPSNWKRIFCTIYAGQAVSLLTSSIVQFAIILYLTDTTRSPIILSISSLMAFLPQGLIGPFAGVLVDRWNRKTIMLISDGAIALACLAIVIVGLFADLPIWLFLVVLFIRGVGSAFHSPSLAAVTPLLVPPEQLTRCAGYSQTLQSATMIISPAIGAILYASWSLEAIVFLDVFGALAGMGTLAVCAIPKLEHKPTLEKPHIIREALDGFRVLREQRGLFLLMLVSTLFMIAFMPVNALYPLMSIDYFGGTAFHASVSEITFSVGLMLGSILLGIWGGFRRKIISIVSSILLMGLALVIVGLLPPSGFWVFAALSAAMGFACPFFSGVVMVIFQLKIAPEYLGRVISLSVSMMALASPIGLTIAGVTADAVGVHNWFLYCGIAIIFCALPCVLIPDIRKCGE